MLDAMPLAEADSTQEDTVPQHMDTPDRIVPGGKAGELPSLTAFESIAGADQDKSLESGIEIPAPSSSSTPGGITQGLQGETNPAVVGEPIGGFYGETFEAPHTIDSEKEDAEDSPGASSDSSADAGAMKTVTPARNRNMATLPSAATTQSPSTMESSPEAEGPTDEQLRAAVIEIIDTAPNKEELTVRKIRNMMKDRFSCALDNRMGLITRAVSDMVNRESNDVGLPGDELSPSDDRADENSGSTAGSAIAHVGSAIAHVEEDEAFLGDMESSSSDSEGSGMEERSPIAAMPRPKPSRTSARRTLAKARMKQGMHAERTSSRRRVVNAEGSDSGRSKADSGSASHSDSDSELDLDSDLPESSVGEPNKQSARGQRVRNGARRRAKKALPPKRTVEGADDGEVAVDRDAALVDSDEDPAKDVVVDPAVKAVVQEELDDVDEKKVKERKRIQAERQRQLEALRTMTSSQLKEATRSAQSSLLAKIKARQDEVHAAIAASAKEELKRLKAEARRAAGMAVEGDGGDEEGDGVDGDVPSDNGDSGTASSGAKAPDELQVEGIVAKEEEAVAAAQREAATAPGAPPFRDEDSGDDEVGERNPAVPSSDQNAKVELRESRSRTEKATREDGGGSCRSSSSSSSSSSEESDVELEIIPATSTGDKSQSSVLGFKPNIMLREAPAPHANRTGPSRGETRSSGRQPAVRALAALPKAIRFTSPNNADKSRAANRRQLVASARHVANDRWAAQLGYRDSQEHIRDLKYMELKRRQQAQVERERREKENAALAARLLEYAVHAKDGEMEFGEGGAGDPSLAETTSSKASSDSTTDGKPDGSAQSSDVSVQHISNDIDNVPDGGSEPAAETDPLPLCSTQKMPLRAERDLEGATNTPDDTGAVKSQDGSDDPQGRVREDKQKPPLSDESSCSRDEEGQGAGGGVTGHNAEILVSPPAPPPACPTVVRTYGRKERKTDGEASEKVYQPEAAGAGELSSESQALWREEPDSVPATFGLGDRRGQDTDDTCNLSLGLDVLDDEETTRPIRMEEAPKAVCPGGSNGTENSVTNGECGDEPLGEVASGDNEAGREITGGIDEPASGAKRKLDDATGCTASEEKGSAETTAAAASTTTVVPSVRKMKVAADGSLRSAAPAQPSLATFFNKVGNSESAVAPSTALQASARAASNPLKKTGIAAFFGKTDSLDAEGGGAGDQLTESASSSEDREQHVAASDEDPASTLGASDTSVVTDSVHDVVVQKATGEGVEGVAQDGKRADVEGKHDEEVVHTEQDSNEGNPAEEHEGEEAAQEEEAPKEPKDRAAEYRAILEAERRTAKRAKKLRKSGMMDDEAEEEEEEEAVRGLGDFGFGVPASGSGTSATGTGGVKDDDEEVDEEIREEDLEGIVDTFSDDEGDKDAQEAFLKDQAVAGERQALKDMVRRVREGFGDERGGHGRSSATRGSLRLDQLTAADRSSRKEARRLGLLNSDEEWSDEEKGKDEEGGLEELDEQALGELLAREQRARHIGLSQTAQEYLESSDSEKGEDNDDDGKGKVDPAATQEELEYREEERVQKLWVKRAKRRRVLAEVEQAGAGASGASRDSQSPGMLMEDEDSQAILNLLQCTNSRHSLGNGTNRSSSSDGGGDGGNDATLSAGTASRSGKRCVRNKEYSGELDAREVANGFGMGMLSMPMKRSRSEGNNPREKVAAKSGTVVDRTFSMPQFVTSVAGFGGSSRAKQAQRKASFLSRAGSFHARSGSLASGKTTVSASKFVFMSSIVGEDGCTRTGFEDGAAREPSALTTGGSNSNSNSNGNSNGYLSRSTSITELRKEASGVTAAKGSGKGGKNSTGRGPGGSETGRLWQSLCAGTKSRR